MRPHVEKELQASYLILCLALVIGMLAVGGLYYWGDVSETREKRDKEYKKLVGPKKLKDRNQKLKVVVEDLEDQITELKRRVGVIEVEPFNADKTGDRGPEQRFLTIFQQIQSDFRHEAQAKGIKFDDLKDFGFDYVSAPKHAIREHYLMLQLITKSVFMAMQAPLANGITEIEIENLGIASDKRIPWIKDVAFDRNGEPTMREYRFTMKVRGVLHDQTWLIHRLVVDQPPTPEHEEFTEFAKYLIEQVDKADPEKVLNGNPFCPLIFRKMSTEPVSILDSSSSNQNDLMLLETTFELAGMEFVLPAEGGEEVKAKPKKRPPQTGGKVVTPP